MAFSENHNAISQTVAGWRSSHDPDGLGRGDGTLDLPPDLTKKMLAGEITPLEARTEWAAREPQQRAFNAEIRRQAGLGEMVADTEQALDPEGRPAMRDAKTGRYADLNLEARAATGVEVPGGLTPTERPVKAPDANDELRDAYWRMKAQRAA